MVRRFKLFQAGKMCWMLALCLIIILIYTFAIQKYIHAIKMECTAVVNGNYCTT